MLSRHNFDNIFKINKHRKQAEKLAQLPSVSKQTKALLNWENVTNYWGKEMQNEGKLKF